MKIVFLDSYTLSNGDLGFKELEQCGELKRYDTSTSDEVLQRCKSAKVIITNKVPLNSAIISKLPELKLICVAATGYDIVDVSSATAKNIIVCNVPAYSSPGVAQQVFALIHRIENKVAYYNDLVKSNYWSSQQHFSFYHHSITELKGKTLGVIGYGGIAKRIIAIAKAYEMRCIVYRQKPSIYDPEVERVNLDYLIENADYISLNAPLTDATLGMVDAAFLSRMKKTAVLINTSRGPLVDEEALFNALSANDIRAAALDVMKEEPPKKDHKLFELDNCIITPHQAWASLESRRRLLATIIDNIEHFKNGTPINQVGV